MSTGSHDLLRVIDTDLSVLMDVDNQLRQDVPGTEGWQDSAFGMTDSLLDVELDPDLYLVAVYLEASAWSTSGDKRVQDRRRCVAIAIRRGRSRARCRAGGCFYQRGPGFDQRIPAPFEGLDPLGLGPHRRARNPKHKCLLLQASGVSDHST